MNIFPNYMMNFVSVLFLTGSVLLGGITNNAHGGGEKKIYSAALCSPTEPIREQESADFTHANGAIYNKSSNHYLHITCPVTRDTTTNINGRHEWRFVGANRTNNRNNGDDFWCTMIARSSTDELLWTLDASLSFHNEARTFKEINFWRDVPGNLGSLGNGGSYYYMECMIPPGNPGEDPSFLASYYVHENW